MNSDQNSFFAPDFSLQTRRVTQWEIWYFAHAHRSSSRSRTRHRCTRATGIQRKGWTALKHIQYLMRTLSSVYVKCFNFIERPLHRLWFCPMAYLARTFFCAAAFIVCSKNIVYLPVVRRGRCGDIQYDRTMTRLFISVINSLSLETTGVGEGRKTTFLSYIFSFVIGPQTWNLSASTWSHCQRLQLSFVSSSELMITLEFQSRKLIENRLFELVNFFYDTADFDLSTRLIKMDLRVFSVLHWH